MYSGDKIVLSQIIDIRDVSALELENFEVREHFENNLRVITFSDQNAISSEHGADQQHLRSMGKLDIETAVISFIYEDFHLCRNEILNLQLDRMSLIVLYYQHINIMEAKIGDLSVKSNKTQANPILLLRQPTQNNTPFMDVFMQASPSQKLIENFKIVISPLIVNISDEIIELLMRNCLSLLNRVSIEIKPNAWQADGFNEFYKLYSKKKEKMRE
jgi:hypothetical protein